MQIKSCPVQIKAAGTHEGTDEGVFEAIVATWDLDSVGDRIVKGAFADTLAAWAKSGDPIPVYWSHRMDDPDYNIGHILEAAETDEGLRVKAQLDMDSPKAAQVYRLLKGRRVTQFSFAYDVEDGAYVEEKGADPYYELRKLKLHEVGPTPIGANQATELLGVKAGRVLSKANEDRVREIHRLSMELLDGLKSAPVVEDEPATEPTETTTPTTTGSEDEKAKPPASPEAPTDPTGSKGAIPAGPSPASLRLRADLAAIAAGVLLTD